MHLLQVGAGSGGMAVLDLVARDPRVTRVSLVEPDTYAPHNVYRHLFPPSSVGRLKAELAAEWVRALRPDISFDVLVADITDPNRQSEFAALAGACDFGICAADNEAAKFAFDALMRAAGKPWTLGEVLSGGIGGWVHRFVPGGACYGCVASHLQREVTEQPAGPPPDYSDPRGARPETTIPASKASIGVIAGLHALVTLELARPTPPPPLPAGRGEKDLRTPVPSGMSQEGSPEFTNSLPGGGRGVGPPDHDFTSLLFSLQVVPGVFDLAYRAHRLRIPRSPTCLMCGVPAPTPTGEQLDAAVDDALARLGAR
jgi:molybdopterin/thiamine biosynthesis adenylyltransferase